MGEQATLLPSSLRRRLLKVTGAFFLTPGLSTGTVLVTSSPTASERTTLATFLDVLLPRDALTGAATDLGVDAKLWAFSELDPRFRQLLVVGCRWLNMTGGAGFSALTSAQKNKVVEWMSSADWNEIPRRFYELLRQAAIETYYSEPSAWGGLPLKSPPQPVGYPPPWQ